MRIRSPGPVFDEDYKPRKNPYNQRIKRYMLSLVVFVFFVFALWILLLKIGT